MKTLVDLLENTVKKHGDKLFSQKRVNEFTNEYYGYTYRRFFDTAYALAKFLKSREILDGAHISLISENKPEWGAGYFAALLNHCVIVPIDAQLHDYEAAHIIEDSDSTAIICSAAQFDKVSGFTNNKKIKIIILLDELKNTGSNIIILKEAVNIGTGLSIHLNMPSPDDTASIIYTSGTTGISKGVILTHRNLVSDIEGVLKIISFAETDRLISVLPLHHTFESTAGFLCAVAVGASVTYAVSLKSKRLIEDIKYSKATILIGVPLLFEKLAASIMKAVKEKPVFTKMLFKSLYAASSAASGLFGGQLGKILFKSLRKQANLHTLRLMVSGGGPLASYISDTYKMLGFTLIQGYGLTEASPVVTVNPIEDCDNNSIGIPLFNINLEISEPGKGGIGEIIIKGPIVMKGYYKNKQATDEVLKNGWLYTGDIGYIGKNNHIYITGRAKNVIVTAGGKNVFPEGIEEKLNQSPFILESLVIGKQFSEKVKTEEVAAVIVPDTEYFDRFAFKPNLKITEEAVYSIIKKEIKRVNESLLPYKKIKDFKIRAEEFPKTSTRKIKRYLFKKEFYKI